MEMTMAEEGVMVAGGCPGKAMGFNARNSTRPCCEV